MLVAVSVSVTKGPGLETISKAFFYTCCDTYMITVVVVVTGFPVVCGMVCVFDGTEVTVDTVIVLVLVEYAVQVGVGKG